MAKCDMKLDAGTLWHEITVTITTRPVTAWRQRAGLWLMKLGVLLAGFGGAEFVESADENEVRDAADRAR